MAGIRIGIADERVDFRAVAHKQHMGVAANAKHWDSKDLGTKTLGAVSVSSLRPHYLSTLCTL